MTSSLLLSAGRLGIVPVLAVQGAGYRVAALLVLLAAPVPAVSPSALRSG